MDRDALQTVAVAVFATLLALAPVGYMAYRNGAPRVATVDLQKLVEEEQQRALAVLGGGARANEEQRAAMEKLSADFAKRLSHHVDSLGADCRCVIINKAALLGGGAIDYTDQLRERMRR